MTLALINDLQKAYNNTKAQIAKDMADLEKLLNPDQLQVIKDSLSNRFKQMAPLFMEGKSTQYREGRDQPRRKNLVPKRCGQPKGKPIDPKKNRLINTLKSMLK